MPRNSSRSDPHLPKLERKRLPCNAAALACIGVSSATLVCIALLVAHWPPVGLADLAISNTLQNLRSETLDGFLVASTAMADAIVLTITDVFIVSLLIVAGLRRAALVSGLVMIGCAAAVESIKWLMQRARPVAELYQDNSAFSFPSGHTANVTVMLLVLIWLARAALPAHKGNALVLIGIALVIGFSRIYLQAHWPSDVVAGYALALCMAALGSILLPDHEPAVPPWVFWSTISVWVAVGAVYTIGSFEQQLGFYGR